MNERIRGAAENVRLGDRGRPAYKRDLDERRILEATCLSCEREATLLLEVGETEPWSHDHRTDHMVEYHRVDE